MLRLLTSSRASLRHIPTFTWGLRLQHHRTFATAAPKTSTSSSTNEGKKSTPARRKKSITAEAKAAARQERIAKQAQLKAELKQARAEKKLRAQLQRAEKMQKRKERRAAIRERKLATIAKARERRENLRLKKAMKLRKPGNAFTFYSRQRFSEIFPLTKNLAETSRRLAADWKSLTPQQKKPFEDAYAAARQQHFAARAQKPKKPLTSYLNFVSQERAKLPKPKGLAGSQQLLKQLSQRWKALPEAEKARYAPSPAVVADYSRAMEAYKAKFIQQIQQQRQQQQQQTH